MTRRGRVALAALAVGSTLVAARGPLHLATHALPVSNDDAIPLLMARAVLRGELSTILWNQPYNGTLDAYLLAPLLLVLDPHAAFRLYEALAGVALVGLAAALAAGAAPEGPDRPRAALAAALLAAVGTPYMALMAATGPTPNFLVPLLVGLPVLAASLARREGGTPPGRSAVAFALGLASGLAVWDSMLALPPLVGAAAGLALAGWRPRPRRALAFAAGAALGLAPLLVARVVGASAASPVTALRPRWLWAAGLRDLLRATAGLLGLEVPLVVDGPERVVPPLALRLLLGASLLALLAVGCRSRRSLPLVGWAGALLGAFALSRRTGGDELRYLFGLVVPVLALAGAGASRIAFRSRVLAAAAPVSLLLPWAWGHGELAERWRDPSHASRVWQVPPLEPALDTLRRAGVTSAYASLQFAGRLGLESGEAVVASQAWNERVPGDPLRFRDEVDLDPRAAWVLSPHLSRGMPRAGGFRSLLAGLGGSWREDLPGDLVVFRGFVPPYDEALPVPAGAVEASALDGPDLPPTVLDRDVATAWRSPSGLGRGSGLRLRLTGARRLSALVLCLDLDESPLAVPWVVEADGGIVACGPAPHGLQWLNGVPRAGRQPALAVPLGGREASEVRLVFQGLGPPLVVREAFLYGPDEERQAADGAEAAARALADARRGEWEAAVAGYAEAVRQAPHRASLHACLLRARWRAAGRRWLDVESLGDGGPALVLVRQACGAGSSPGPRGNRDPGK